MEIKLIRLSKFNKFKIVFKGTRTNSLIRFRQIASKMEI